MPAIGWKVGFLYGLFLGLRAFVVAPKKICQLAGLLLTMRHE